MATTVISLPKSSKSRAPPPPPSGQTGHDVQRGKVKVDTLSSQSTKTVSQRVENHTVAAPVTTRDGISQGNRSTSPRKGPSTKTKRAPEPIPSHSAVQVMAQETAVGSAHNTREIKSSLDGGTQEHKSSNVQSRVTVSLVHTTMNDEPSKNDTVEFDPENDEQAPPLPLTAPPTVPLLSLPHDDDILNSSIDSDISDDEVDGDGRAGGYDVTWADDVETIADSIVSNNTSVSHGKNSDDSAVIIISHKLVSEPSHAHMRDTTCNTNIVTNGSNTHKKLSSTEAEKSKGNASSLIGSSIGFIEYSEVRQSATETNSAPKLDTGRHDINEQGQETRVPMPEKQSKLLEFTASLIRNQKMSTPRELSPRKEDLPSPVYAPNPFRHVAGSNDDSTSRGDEVAPKVTNSSGDATAAVSRDIVVVNNHQETWHARKQDDQGTHRQRQTYDKCLGGGPLKSETRKDVEKDTPRKLSSKGHGHLKVDADSLQAGVGSGSSKSSNPSDYGYMYSAERTKPPPEVGWKDRPEGDPTPVNLYSENVMKEGDTTDSIDRESIANLSSIKQRWETMFTSNAQAEAESGSAKQKAPPKWEVRLHYKEKHAAPSPAMHETESVERSERVESAIEHEIRLAHEREEMLKREKAEQMIKQQHEHQRPIMTEQYEGAGPESEFYQPEFEELAEADRVHDPWGEGRNRDKLDLSESNSNTQESFIEREIRQQQEREAELARLRHSEKHTEIDDTAQEPHYLHEVERLQGQFHDEQSSDMVDSSLGASFISEKQQGEEEEQVDSVSTQNLITRELQQLQEREEEFRRTHSIYSDSATSQTESVRSSGSFSQEPREIANTSGGSSRRGSLVTSPAPSSALGSSLHSNLAREEEEEDEKPSYFQEQETPMQREIRIARERENDLRRQKGLPEISAKQEDEGYSSYSGNRDSANPGFKQDNFSIVSTPRSSSGSPMQKYASHRLQQELQQQKEREQALRSEGKIRSTSEEHIQTVKYRDLAKVEKVDHQSKRNFEPSTPRKSSITPEPETVSMSETPPKRTSVVATGGKLFSYHEFKQTAESKIERELRDLREREEELKNIRLSTKSD